MFVLWTGCSTIAELSVHYELPPASEELAGRSLALSVEDARSTKDILGAEAEEVFRHFGGKVSYSYARHGQEGFRQGLYEVPELFEAAFRKKLENLGMNVREDAAPGVPEMVVRIEEYALNLVGRQWVGRAVYEARMLEEGRWLAAQQINGRAERARIFGRRQADELMSELFTDVVNRLDVHRLLEQAALVRP